jgi:heat shock protein HslJ
MNLKRMYLSKAGLTLILVLLAACRTPLPRSTPIHVGTEWVLILLNGESLIEDTGITLNFAEEFLSGSMSCNGYGGGPDSGKYIATDDVTLTIPLHIAVTAQLCSTPEGVMEQEAAYIEALRSAASYRVVDDRLEISNAADMTTLVFVRKEE